MVSLLYSQKYEAVIVVHRIEGLSLEDKEEKKKKLVVEIKWKGALSPLLKKKKKIVKRNLTDEGGFCGDGIVEWNEEFNNLCKFSGFMDGFIRPWEVQFTVFDGLKGGTANECVVLGSTSLNLREFSGIALDNELGIKLPLVSPSNQGDISSLCVSVKLRQVQDFSKTMLGSIVPVTSSPQSHKSSPNQKKEPFSIKSQLKKVNFFKGCVSASQTQNDNKESSNVEHNEVESDESGNGHHSIDYETLVHANRVRVEGYTGGNIIDGEDKGSIHHKSNARSLLVESCRGTSEQQSLQRRIFSWRKRALSFSLSFKKDKEEPLLKKDYREEGGDDIDFDRRQLSSSDESSFEWCKSEGSGARSSFSEFGEDGFFVGSWQNKEIVSRDGHMKLEARVFFASIDQRSERAAGESACTALVAVIANWLHSNPLEMPVKSEFDSLIREGSLEWRNLCENEDYIHRFPDKHFDLDTVLQAKIRPLSVIPEKSFIGFFQPEGLEVGPDFDFLHGAMSFDTIWEEIVHHVSERVINALDPLIYIISWNDHFFLLKVDHDACYIIDTLGERLYEGCNQAYVLKFDKDTTVQRLPREAKPLNDKVKGSTSTEEKTQENSRNKSSSKNSEEEIVCVGKDSCKEYIKSFLAAVPIRELQADVKKGLIGTAPLHHRLQIEFNYTQILQQQQAVDSVVGHNNNTRILQQQQQQEETVDCVVVHNHTQIFQQQQATDSMVFYGPAMKDASTGPVMVNEPATKDASDDI